MPLSVRYVKLFLPEFKGSPENKGNEHNFYSVRGLNCVRRQRSPFQTKGSFFMSENRLAVVSLIIEDRAQSTKINSILSEFGNFVVGRMGVPYKERGVSVICVIVDAPNEIINTITGKIGMLDGVHAKTLMSKM